MLIREFTNKEIKFAIFGSDRNNCPRSHGFNFTFFKKF